MEPGGDAERVAAVARVCIARIEALGVGATGIYRVSGAVPAVRALYAKMREVETLGGSTVALEQAVAEVRVAMCL